jgi:hypothetical protein
MFPAPDASLKQDIGQGLGLVQKLPAGLAQGQLVREEQDRVRKNLWK